MYRILGTDLTQIDGVSSLTAQVIFTEIGPDLSDFKNVGHFCSWLGLCPNNNISGGKVLSSHTRPGSNRVAQALSFPPIHSGTANLISATTSAGCVPALARQRQ